MSNNRRPPTTIEGRGMARIDASFSTLQRDLFESGLAATIGANAFAVWCAIKSHADYSTGKAWPGSRRLAELTGLSKPTVLAAIHTLIDAMLLRVDKTRPSGGRTYVARERLDVRLGERVLCTVVIDYVPAKLRGQLRAVEEALRGGSRIEDAAVDIIPGPGMVWDAAAGVLKGTVAPADLPADPDAARVGIEQARKALKNRPPGQPA